ncbi:MAG: ChaN family lipoprotein, partial [Magnetococcales bacterium]|nr:ChaN family lipoprotein [Magnetococcales bacterium]
MAIGRGIHLMFLALIIVMALLGEVVMQSPVALEPGQIIQTETRTPLTEPELVHALAQQRVVLTGEQHDNPDHHRIQYRLIDGLHH